MKVAIIYPPLENKGKFPLLTQNRHFRYSSSHGVRIFPLIPASGATLLKNAGHDVLFLDGIASRLTQEEFMRKLVHFHPDLIFIETKAPVVKKHWALIERLKEMSDWNIAIGGDHVSYFPEESLIKSPVDYCIAGGDYDVSLLMLANALEKKGELPQGLYYRKDDGIVSTGKPVLLEDLDSLPFIDRDLMQWSSYGEAYLYKPCAYILTGRGCGTRKGVTGRCTFCIWQFAFWDRTARLRSPENVAEEIEALTKKYMLREVFDDTESGAIWDTHWLERFHKEMEKRRLIGKIFISSNARGDCLDKETCALLRRTGFRLLKVGLESGSNESLARLKKDESVEEIVQGVKNAKDVGLNVMLTVMTGYPWEGEDDVKRTYDILRSLMLYKTHVGDALSASILLPYPGTPLYYSAKKNGWLIPSEGEYEKFDMSMPVLRSDTDPSFWCGKMWKILSSPRFVLKTALTMRRREDVRLLMRAFRSLLRHIKDFNNDNGHPPD